MPHRHRISDIALQAGVSRATVDRVLHGRSAAGERSVRAVEQAVAELDRQARRVQLRGRPFVVDVVMTAPERFTRVVRDAVEAEVRAWRSAIRVRFDLREGGSDAQVATALRRAVSRGTGGIVLKAPDTPVVRAAIADAVAAGVGVVTFVTDVPGSDRHAYVGVDNEGAGACAAYLLDLAVGPRAADALVVLSRAAFAGEELRAQGFAREWARLRPGSDIVRVDGTDGLDARVEVSARAALVAHPHLGAVYSIGGANRGTVAAFRAVDRQAHGYVAHDLDEDNTALLREGALTAVLHHDLRHDARRLVRSLLQVARRWPGSPVSVPSGVQVVTPHNVPAALGP